MDETGRHDQKLEVLTKNGQSSPVKKMEISPIKSIGKEWTKSAGPIKKVLKV